MSSARSARTASRAAASRLASGWSMSRARGVRAMARAMATPLALAAGELGRAAVQQRPPGRAGGRPRPPGRRAGARPAHEREADVVGDGQMWIERVVLEHQRDAPVAGRDVVHVGRRRRGSRRRSASPGPAMSRSTVDFPLPVGPSSTSTSPSATVRLIPSTATTPVGIHLSDLAHLDAGHNPWCTGRRPLLNRYCPSIRPVTATSSERVLGGAERLGRRAHRAGGPSRRRSDAASLSR